jgi:hypothetical protein
VPILTRACLITQYHTTQDKFDTPLGNSITDGLKKLFEKYNLGKVWGKSPQHYTLFRDPTTSSRSALKMFVEEALPVALSDVPTVTKYRYFVIGTGVLRYDVFEGEFNQNDQLTASPYPDKLYCIPNVSLKDAKATAQKMNQMTSSAMSSFSGAETETEPHYARWRMEVDQTRLRWLASMNNVESAHVAENPTLGYVTKDVSASPVLPPSSRSSSQQPFIDAYCRNVGRRNQEMATTRHTSH